MITRTYSKIEDLLITGEVFVIYGSRQVGKTTLVQQFLQRTNLKYQFIHEKCRYTILTSSKNLSLRRENP